jgi:acyl-CoA reductase-like NAD-dependent aldehyde dehydrogenase
VSLELGNNAPVIVQPDGRLEGRRREDRRRRDRHAGQSCISVQRVLVHTSIAEDFTAALVEAVDALVVGDPLDDDTQVSALITGTNRDRVRLDRRGRRRRRDGGDRR